MDTRNNNQSTAYDKIKRLIMTAELPPGTKISKRDLVKRLGIGETPAREAILSLEKEGLLYIMPQSGTYVSKIKMQEVYEALFVRETIEKLVFSEACDKITPEEIISLEKKIQIQKIYEDLEEPEIYFQMDEEFHSTFYSIAGKNFVWKWMQLLNTQLSRYRYLRLKVPALPRHSITEDHEELLQLVQMKKKEQVEQLVSKHLHLIDQDVRYVQAEFSTYFDG